MVVSQSVIPVPIYKAQLLRNAISYYGARKLEFLVILQAYV